MPGGSKGCRQHVPESLETIIGHLGELLVLFGDAGGAAMVAIEDDLRQALAARDRGGHPEAVGLMVRAMERLVHLADNLEPDAAMAMRVLIERFRRALIEGRQGEARQAADIMREMSGARLIKEDG